MALLINDLSVEDAEFIRQHFEFNRVPRLRRYLQDQLILDESRIGWLPANPTPLQEQVHEVQGHLLTIQEHGSDLWERVDKILKEEANARMDEAVVATNVDQSIRQSTTETSSLTLPSMDENMPPPPPPPPSELD